MGKTMDSFNVEYLRVRTQIFEARMEKIMEDAAASRKRYKRFLLRRGDVTTARALGFKGCPLYEKWAARNGISLR